MAVEPQVRAASRFLKGRELRTRVAFVEMWAVLRSEMRMEVKMRAKISSSSGLISSSISKTVSVFSFGTSRSKNDVGPVESRVKAISVLFF